jgi:photosystem II stability/assembly factor-like uncharacterized protein
MRNVNDFMSFIILIVCCFAFSPSWLQKGQSIMRTLLKNMTVCLFIILLTGMVKAQWIQTSLDSVNVLCLADSGQYLFAGTDNNGIYRSSDDGMSWITVNTGLTNYGVQALVASENNYFAGTSSGVFISTNNGATWATTGELLNVHVIVVSGSKVFAGHGHCGRGGCWGGIRLTTNNGFSWTELDTEEFLYMGVWDISLYPTGKGETNIFAGTWGGGVFRSADSGRSWTASSSGLPNGYVSALAVSGTRLFASTDSGVYVSTNTGANWTPANTPFLSFSTIFQTDSYLLAGTDNGVSLSTNNGVDWIFVNSGLSNLSVSSFAIGGSYLHVGTSSGVWKRPLSEMIPTSSWIRQNSGTTNNLRSVCFTDANTGTVVGDSGTILRTINGGVGWTNQSIGTGKRLCSVSFTDIDTGTAVGDSGTILRTIDGGTSWSVQASGTNYTLRSVFFTDANTGTTVGDGGTILHTTNGGLSWYNQSPETKSSKSSLLMEFYAGVCFADPQHGTIVGGMTSLGGDDQTILHTSNGGETWTVQSDGGIIPLQGISFSDTNHGIVVGGAVPDGFPGFGVIRQTTNGGATWTNVSANYLNGVSFTDTLTGTAVGWGGTILRTIDGGTTWLNQPSGTTMSLSCVSFTDQHTGTVVGDSGTILRTTTGGVTWIEENRTLNLPQKYILNQNYPNPFNPVTTISYQLPTQSHVTLEIFDVLGREVATLVNRVEEPGYKSVTFDVGAIHESPLPSGVYFYRIQAGNFMETKKLLLIR